jgi:hypothetical protein
MAEVVAISLEVDSGNSVNEVKKLEDAIKDINNSSSTNTIEQKFKTLNTTLESNTASFGEMSQAIEAYKTIALNAGRTSPVGKEALKNASILKDRITDLDREVDNLAQDGRRMQGAMQISQGVMGGYSAFIGITALAGEGNEALEKTLVKLTATMSIMQGIEQIRLATEKESSSMKLLLGARTKVLTALNFLYTASIGATTGAMKLLRIALLSTGIGALVVLLGYIIAKWDDWKDTVISFIKGALSPLIDVLQYLGIVESDLEKERRTNHEKEMQRIQERREALGSVRDKAEQDLKNEIEIANARGENTDKSQKKLLKLTRDNAQKRIDDNNALLEEIDSGNRVATEEEYENTQNSIIADRNLREGAEQDLKVFDATKSKERREARKVQSEKKTEAQKKEDELMLQLQKDLEDIIIENERDEDVRELAKLQLQQERDLQALRDKYGLKTELEKELLIKQNTDLNELKKEIFLKNQEEGALILEEILELEGEENPVIEKMRGEALTELDILKAKLEVGLITEKEYAKKTQAIYDAKHSMRVEELNSAGSISNSLASLFAKNEKIQKANALVQIGIDTAKAISALVAQSQGNPMNLVTGGLAGFAQLATGLASIAGNVAKAKQLLSGGGGSITGGSGVTPPSISVPSTSTINSQSTNGDGSGGFNLPTNRVVLVESDLRMMQERRNNSDIISTI